MRKLCIYLLFDWFSGENCIIFTFFFLQKGRQTSTDQKETNDGTIVFLTSLVTALT